MLAAKQVSMGKLVLGTRYGTRVRERSGRLTGLDPGWLEGAHCPMILKML